MLSLSAACPHSSVAWPQSTRAPAPSMTTRAVHLTVQQFLLLAMQRLRCSFLPGRIWKCSLPDLSGML